jgi:hypothetical protein
MYLYYEFVLQFDDDINISICVKGKLAYEKICGTGTGGYRAALDGSDWSASHSNHFGSKEGTTGTY